MSIKMIAVDLDETLLKSDKTISNYTAEILSICQQHGILVVFATARSESDCTQHIDAINPDAIISNRGAIVRVGNNIIHRATIDAETTNKILRSCLEQPSVRYICAYTDAGYFFNVPENEHDPTIWGKYNHDMYTDFSQGLQCDAYKITVEIYDDMTASTIASSFPAVDVIRFSGESWYSFGNKSISKWEGIKILAAHFSIDTKDILAFGDDYSDIEMLRGCGIGVAVDNAISEVKAVADCVCGENDNDGVAKWIAENVMDIGSF